MKRFAFGKNWQEYSSHLTKTHILSAENSLVRLLGREKLRGRSFLDVGSGSGLFSLAAARLGAKSIQGFDIDPVNQLVSKENLKRFQHLVPSGTPHPKF